MTGSREKHMVNCPSVVETASTQAIHTADGVDLVITSPDPKAQRRIVELAALHSKWGETDVLVPHHSGKHGGPGALGYCPVIHTGTIVTYTEIEGGARIHVAARRADDVPAVQRLTQQRVDGLPRTRAAL